MNVTGLMPEETIFKYCNEVQSFVQAHFEADIPNACVARLQGAEAYMGLTAKMLADAKYYFRQKGESEWLEKILEAIGQHMSASTVNKYVEVLVREESYFVDWVERLNRACTHICENCRTLISKHKAEMQMNQFGGGGGAMYGQS